MLSRFSLSSLFPGALSLCVLAGAAPFNLVGTPARADETRPLERRFGASDNTPALRDLSQREFADAATQELGFLANLRSWRDTLRGRGTRRDFQAPPLRGEKLAFSLGGVAPSEFGGGAGVAARWSRLEIGSTAQPKALDEVLARFDSYLAGQTIEAQKPMELNWLRARLSESKNAQIEISMARARRDLPDSTPGIASETAWRDGNFQRATAKFKLPAKWSLSGDYGRVQVERGAKNEVKSGAKNEDEDASAWGFDAAGPVAHPFGVASARASWREVDDGYLTPTQQNGALGAKNGALELAQDLKMGRLSGNLRFGANTRARAEVETARAGEELERNQTQSTAQMRLAVTPNLSFTGGGNWNSALTQRALIDQKTASAANSETENAADKLLTPAQARELSRQLAGDVGVQWNFSKALSLAVTLGTSSQDAHREIGDLLQMGPQSEEGRRALELRKKTGDSDFRLRFSQRARRDAAANVQLNSATGAAISQWRIEAARAIIGNVRLKTILDFASDTKADQNAHRIEAQLQLARAARFDARYREGNLPAGLMSDEWSSVFANSSAAPRQWSARFGAGSAASGAGLGLAVEVARSQGNVPDTWRVGLQFK